MILFNRKHPYFVYAVGIFLCGIKFPFNWINRDNEHRQSEMEKTSFGILPSYDGSKEDAPMVDAWNRIEGLAPDGDGLYNRLSHNVTNLPIEHGRKWITYAIKFLSSLIVWGLIIFNLVFWGLWLLGVL